MRTALIINDSTLFRKVLASILQKLEFSVQEADDSTQGLNSCVSNMPDLILLDAQMMTGGSLSTLSAIRHLDGGDKPKIIALTSTNDVTVIAWALHEGANKYLIKPFDGHTVREKLLEVGAL